MIPASIIHNLMTTTSDLLDMTTLTLVDPGTVFSSTAPTRARLTATNIQRGTVAYAYADYGASAIGDFSYDFDFRITAAQSDSNFDIISVKNALGANTVDPAQFVRFNQAGGNDILIQQRNGSVSSSTPYGISLATTYYCRFSRVGTDLTLGIASSAENRDSGTWLNTQTLSGALTTTWRYLNVIESFDGSGTQTASLYIENAVIDNG